MYRSLLVTSECRDATMWLYFSVGFFILYVQNMDSHVSHQVCSELYKKAGSLILDTWGGM